MKYRILLTFLCLSLLSGFVSAKEAVWIDVRTPNEFASGHLEQAINIPHATIAQKIASIVKDKSAAIHLYCRSGNRAGVAKRILDGLGYTNVTNEGGYRQLMSKVKKPQ